MEPIWKFWPEVLEIELSMEDSTEGKGWRSDISGGGGVRACWRGEAV